MGEAVRMVPSSLEGLRGGGARGFEPGVPFARKPWKLLRIPREISEASEGMRGPTLT